MSKDFDPTSLPLPPTPDISAGQPSVSSTAESSEPPKEEATIPINEPSFEDALDKFFIFSEKVLNYSSNDLLQKLKSEDHNPLLTSLKSYKNAYNISEKTRRASIHKENFAKVYNECRPFFIKATNSQGFNSLKDFMDWLSGSTPKSSSIVIQISEKTKSKIMISAIARVCLRIRNDLDGYAKQALKQDDEDSAMQYRSDPAFQYLQVYVLHLMRLFYFCADITDRNALIGPKLSELESELGVESETEKNNQGGLNDLVHMAAGVAKKIGVKGIPDNFNANSNHLKEALSEMSKNPQVTETLKTLMSGIDFHNPQALSSAFSGIVEKLGKVPKPEAVQRAESANILTKEESLIKKVSDDN